MILPERVLGRSGTSWMWSGVAIGPISVAHVTAQDRHGVVAGLGAGLEDDVGVDALTLDVVREADDRGLGDQRVRYERGLDLGGTHAVTGDVDDVVDATHAASSSRPRPCGSRHR